MYDFDSEADRDRFVSLTNGIYATWSDRMLVQAGPYGETRSLDPSVITTLQAFLDN